MVSLRQGLEAEAGAAAEEAPVVNEGLDEPKQLKEGVLRVLQGHLDHLPTMNSKIVRIFTSSTFTGEKNFSDVETFSSSIVRTLLSDETKVCS